MPPSPNQRRHHRAPLVLTGHGMHLRINHGALEVQERLHPLPPEAGRMAVLPRRSAAPVTDHRA